MSRVDAELAGQVREERRRVLGTVAIVAAVVGDELRVAPDRFAILAPVARQRPARQRLAGVPLPLPEMEQRPRSETIAEPAKEDVGTLALRRPEGVGVPLGLIAIL